MKTQQDRWLLPTCQCERPGLALLPEATLHGRREGTFLVFAAIVLSTTVAAALVGGTILDVTDTLGIELPLATMPTGALLAPVALTAALIVCEVYARRRALALVLTATLSSIAVLAICDFGLAPLAMAAALGGALFVVVFAMSAMNRALDGRQTWLRAVFALVLAQGVAAAIYDTVLVIAGADSDATLAMASAMWAFGAACALVSGVVLAVAKRALGSYLRVIGLPSLGYRLPAAFIIDEMPTEPHLPVQSEQLPARRFTTAEVEFFDEGEHLEDVEVVP